MCQFMGTVGTWEPSFVELGLPSTSTGSLFAYTGVGDAGDFKANTTAHTDFTVGFEIKTSGKTSPFPANWKNAI